jgi:tetratricopeptide (TPR) repeat protein
MPDIHITRELLRAVARGELPPRLLTQIGTQHLMRLCPHCRAEIEAWRREREVGPGADYGPVLNAFIERQLPRLERGRRAALRDLKALLSLPEAERVGRIKRARRHFRGAALVELLLAESQKRLHENPEGALHFAELAAVVVQHSPTLPNAFDLLALADGYMANAVRATGALRDSEKYFQHARHVITQEGVTDPDILARIDDLEGSLRRDQRRFAEAEELFARSVMLYRLGGSQIDASRVLLNLGTTYFFAGQIERAVTTTREALRKISRIDEPRLFMCGRYNLARYLVEAGAYHEAADILATEADLFRKFPEPWTQLRVTWLKGKLAAGRGEYARAEQAFLEARDGFIVQGIGYDAAMVSVEDLAPLYLRQGRTAEVKRLAEEMFPIFQAADVHPEALAALMYFQEAAVHEALTLSLARELAMYLRDARPDPSLRFTRPRTS